MEKGKGAALLEQLEIVQQNIACPLNEKEEQIFNIVNNCRGEEELSAFLNALVKESSGHRLLQIVEQYPRVYENMMDDSNASLFLDTVTSLRSIQLVQIVESMVSVILKTNPPSRSTSSPIIDFALRWLKFDDLSVSERGGQILVDLIHIHHYEPSLLQYLFQQLFELSLAHKEDSVLLLRYFSVAIRLSKANQPAAEAFVASRLLNLLYELCRSEDILAAVNAMELLAEVAQGVGSNTVLSALCRDMPALSTSTTFPSCITWLASLCVLETSPTFDGFLRDTAMRTLTALFAHAVHSSFGFLDVNFDQLIMTATSLMAERAGDIQSRLAGLAVVSDLAQVSSYWMQRVLFPAQDPALETLTAWLSLLHGGKTELAAAALFAFAQVLERPEEQYIAAAARSTPSTAENVSLTSSDVTDMKRRLTLAIGQSKKQETVKYLIAVAKQPVSPVRIAAMEVLRVMATQSWAKPFLFPTSFSGSGSSLAQSEFLQYLLDRTTEHDKEGKDAKFAMIEAVRRQEAAFRLLSEDAQYAINQAIAQGPYFMPPRLEEMQTL